eukprot:2247028-Lingulodinium_polyedra.AAC.1
MTRLNQCFVGATARKPHARALHTDTKRWRAHGARKRAICEPLRWRNIDLTAPLCNVSRTLRNDAAESMFR